jgi:hypothetical protein
MRRFRISLTVETPRPSQLNRSIGLLSVKNSLV